MYLDFFFEKKLFDMFNSNFPTFKENEFSKLKRASSQHATNTYIIPLERQKVGYPTAL
jgi:hypothetical protein